MWSHIGTLIPSLYHVPETSEERTAPHNGGRSQQRCLYLSLYHETRDFKTPIQYVMQVVFPSVST